MPATPHEAETQRAIMNTDRPLAVRNAVAALLVLLVVITVYSGIVMARSPPAHAPSDPTNSVMLAVTGLNAAIVAGLAYLIWSGRGWARWVVAVWLLFTVVSIATARSPDPAARGLVAVRCVEALLLGFSIGCMFRSEARRWFRARAEARA